MFEQLNDDVQGESMRANELRGDIHFWRCLELMFATFARLNLSRWAATQIDFLAFHEARWESMKSYEIRGGIVFLHRLETYCVNINLDRCQSIQMEDKFISMP